MERDGVLDPLTGAVPVVAVPEEAISEQRVYDEVLAETEEPITSNISTVASTANVTPTPAAPAPASAPAAPAAVAATDIFHSMAVDPNARKPKGVIVIVVILALLGGAGAAAYMLGIFK
jgi:hypothetical protein